MSADASLAARQTALVRALTGRGPVPIGLDAGRVDVVARSLLIKRARSIRRTWPELARGLGDDFDRLFVAYASQTPLPRSGGVLADGDAFVEHLLALGKCPDGACLERLAVGLAYRRTADGLVRRPPWSIVVRCMILRGRRRPSIGVRVFRWTAVF